MVPFIIPEGWRICFYLEFRFIASVRLEFFSLAGELHQLLVMDTEAAAIFLDKKLRSGHKVFHSQVLQSVFDHVTGQAERKQAGMS